MKRPISLCLTLALAVGCSKKPEAKGPPRGGGGPVPVHVGEVVRKDVPLDLRAIGNVESIASVAVKAQVGGELLEVNFKEGQEVRKGDLLFSIQPKLYVTQLAQAEANLARDRAAAANARRDAERNSALGDKGAISKEQLDQMRSTAEAADATVKADEALVEIARVRVGYATVESPINGRTGAVKVQAGNLIKENADEPMVTIRQLAPIYVTFALPEQYLGDIRAGSEARPLVVTALDSKTGKSLGQGDLTFIDNAVDTSTGTVTLKATFANEDRALWPGAFVDVLLRLKVLSGVTVVPASAITVGQRGTQAFVVKGDGTAELRTVVVERNSGDETVIQSGLEVGEKVVVNGQSRLVPGAKVVVAPAISPDAAPGAPVATSKGAQP